VSEAAAPSAVAEATTTDATRRSPLSAILHRLPTPILVTVIGALLSAWVIPAVTRQWQDQQKARELKAALVERIGRNTTEALVKSDFVDYGRFGGDRLANGAPPFSDEQFNDLDIAWRQNSEEIEGELAAYFPHQVAEWHRYATLVINTYFLLRPRVYLRVNTLDLLHRMGYASEQQVHLLARPFTTLPASDARNAYYLVTQRLLDAKRKLTNDILHAHAAGYSQGPRDFLHDLLPFV
jgi:hypothetical protein